MSSSQRPTEIPEAIAEDVSRLQGGGLEIVDKVPDNFMSAVLVCPTRQDITALVHRQLRGIAGMIRQHVRVLQDGPNVIFAPLQSASPEELADAANQINEWIDAIDMISNQRNQLALLCGTKEAR